MRYATLLCSALLLVACAEAGDDTDDMAADTLPAAAPAPAGIETADLAGTWAMQAMPEGSDSVVATYHLWASADPAAWRMKFDHQDDTLAVRVVEVAGDSIVTEVGPYASALRSGVMVTTRSSFRMEGDTLVGVSVARYDVTTADSVRRIRVAGTRVP